MGLGVVDRRGFPHLRAGLLGRISLFTRFIRVSVKVSKRASSLLADGECWPCGSNSVCLSPFASRAKRVGVLVGLQPGFWLQGQCRTSYAVSGGRSGRLSVENQER